MRTQLLAALVLGVLATPALSAPTSPTGQVISDPRIGADCRKAGTAHTPDVAVRGKVVAATWTIGQDAGIALALSKDGGRSWSRRPAPFSTCTGGVLEFLSDPDLALGADGTPWLSVSGNLPPSEPATVSTGEMEGRTLVAVGDGPAVSVFPGVTTERGFLETDARDARRGWVLAETLTRAFLTAGPVAGPIPPVGSVGPEGSLLIGSTEDGGRTWTRTTVRAPSPGATVIALGLVSSGSALVALSVEVDPKDPLFLAGLAAGLPKPQAARGAVASQTSTDGGRTWSQPVVLGVVEQSTLVDAASGGGVLAVAAPQPDGTMQAWVSEDTGRTWRQSAAAVGVALPATGVDVDQRGNVSVLSYAVEDDLRTPQLSTSRDRGKTWSPPVALAAPFAAATRSDSHKPPAGPYNGADHDGRDVLVAVVADDDRNGATEARLVRVRQPGR